MRLPEADCQEERPVLHLVEHAHRLGSHPAVVIGVVGDIAALAVRRRREVRRQCARNLRLVVAMVRVVEELRRAPRAGVAFLLRVPVVEDLAGAARGVAVLLEPERERRHLRVSLAEVRAVVPEAQRVRPPSCQHRRPRWVAHRLLTVRAIELHRPPRQAVEVRRQGRRAEAGQLGPEVIGHDQEDVRPRCPLLCSEGGERKRREGECADESFHDFYRLLIRFPDVGGLRPPYIYPRIRTATTAPSPASGDEIACNRGAASPDPARCCRATSRNRPAI